MSVPNWTSADLARLVPIVNAVKAVESARKRLAEVVAHAAGDGLDLALIAKAGDMTIEEVEGLIAEDAMNPTSISRLRDATGRARRHTPKTG